MKKVRLTCVALAMAALSATGCNDKKAQNATSEMEQTETVAPTTETASTEKLTRKDSTYMSRVALTDLKEINVGNLAVNKNTSEQTISFGKMLIDDHTQSSKELTSLTDRANFTAPSEMDAKGKEAMTQLSALNGKEFDKAFAMKMVDGHKEAIALMKEIASGADSEALRNWASGKIPVLNSHLQHAESLQKK